MARDTLPKRCHDRKPVACGNGIAPQPQHDALVGRHDAAALRPGRDASPRRRVTLARPRLGINVDGHSQAPAVRHRRAHLVQCRQHGAQRKERRSGMKNCYGTAAAQIHAEAPGSETGSKQPQRQLEPPVEQNAGDQRHEREAHRHRTQTLAGEREIERHNQIKYSNRV